MNSPIPKNKRALNTHISIEEHTYLKRAARTNAMTVTMFLRNLIRREMRLASQRTIRRATRALDKLHHPADSGVLTTTTADRDYQG